MDFYRQGMAPLTLGLASCASFLPSLRPQGRACRSRRVGAVGPAPPTRLAQSANPVPGLPQRQDRQATGAASQCAHMVAATLPVCRSIRAIRGTSEGPSSERPMTGNGNSGRAKKPAALKRLEGNRGRRKIQNEPTAGRHAAMPDYFDEEQRRAWLATVAYLPKGLLTAADFGLPRGLRVCLGNLPRSTAGDQQVGPAGARLRGQPVRNPGKPSPAKPATR